MRNLLLLLFLNLCGVLSYSQIKKIDKKHIQNYSLIEFKDSIINFQQSKVSFQKTLSLDTISNQLEKIFQESFDSTIIYYPTSTFGLVNDREFFFIGKKNDSIYYYRYFSPIDETNNRKFGPKGSLIDKLFNKRNFYKKITFYHNLTFDDRFYLIYSESSKGSLWEKIQSDNIWNLSENESEIKVEGVEETSDGPYYTYRLITKGEVYQIYLYYPEDYPISKIFHLRNRISDVTKWVKEFYSNHKLDYKK